MAPDIAKLEAEIQSENPSTSSGPKEVTKNPTLPASLSPSQSFSSQASHLSDDVPPPPAEHFGHGAVQQPPKPLVRQASAPLLSNPVEKTPLPPNHPPPFSRSQSSPDLRRRKIPSPPAGPPPPLPGDDVPIPESGGKSIPLPENFTVATFNIAFNVHTGKEEDSEQGTVKRCNTSGQNCTENSATFMKDLNVDLLGLQETTPQSIEDFVGFMGKDKYKYWQPK